MGWPKAAGGATPEPRPHRRLVRPALADLTALAPNSAVAETELGIGVSSTALASANDFQLLVWPQAAKRIGELLPYNWSPPVRSDGPTASCSRS